jgi:hypothetical protein
MRYVVPGRSVALFTARLTDRGPCGTSKLARGLSPVEPHEVADFRAPMGWARLDPFRPFMSWHSYFACPVRAERIALRAGHFKLQARYGKRAREGRGCFTLEQPLLQQLPDEPFEAGRARDAGLGGQIRRRHSAALGVAASPTAWMPAGGQAQPLCGQWFAPLAGAGAAR